MARGSATSRSVHVSSWPTVICRRREQCHLVVLSELQDLKITVESNGSYMHCVRPCPVRVPMRAHPYVSMSLRSG